MKKIIFTVVASALAVSSTLPICVSAESIVDSHEFSFSTEIVESNIEIEGFTIPNGTVAVTVSVENNLGFTDSATKLNLGSAYNILKDADDNPLIITGDAISNSIYSCAENENNIVFVTASIDTEKDSGEMFTFFASKDNRSADDYISICDIDDEPNNSVMSGGLGFCIYGDFNDDDQIDATDATAAWTGLSKTGVSELPYDIAVLCPNYYFPDIYSIDSAYIWNDWQNMTYDNTPQVILDYYAKQSVHQPYPYTPGLRIGFAFSVSSTH